MIFCSLRSVLPFLLFLISAVVISQPSQAQTGNVQGRVVSADTGEPIADVNVGLEGTTKGAATSQNGRFTIQDVQSGTYTVVVSFVGYETVRREVNVRSNQVTRLNVELSPDAAALSEIQVISEQSYRSEISSTALRTNTPVIETARSVTSVNKVLLNQQAALTKKDIYRNVAGLNEFAFNNDVTLRGFRVSSPVLYNGLRGNPYNIFHLDPKLTNIDRVDVLKGPSSVTFGSLPPGGLINFVTKKPQPIASQQVGIRAGSFDQYNVQGHLTGPLTDDQTLLYRLDAEVEDAGSFRNNQESDFINLTGALSWNPNQRVSLTIEGGIFDETLGGRRERGIPFFNDQVFAVPISYTSHESTDFFKSQVYFGEAHFDYTINESVRFNASTRYYQNEAREEYHEPRGVMPDQADVDGDGDTDELIMVRNFRSADREGEGFSANSNLIWKVNTGSISHKILAGGDVLIEETKAPRFQRALSTLSGGDVPTLEVFSPEYNPGLSDTYQLGAFIGGSSLENFQQGEARQFGSRNTRIGVYVQDQVSIGRLRLTGAVRFEHFNDNELFGGDEFSDQQVTFRGGALYKILDDWSLYGSYSESYEPQSVGVQDAGVGGPFDPEDSWQIEVGTKVNLIPNQLFATVAGYLINRENVLVTSPDNPELLEALGEVESQGIEIELVGNITSRLRVSGNYAYNDIEITEDSNPDLEGETFPNAPEDQAALWISYEFLDGNLAVAGGPTFVGERETFSSPPNLPSYTRFDASVSYRYNLITVRMNIENITDERYISGGFGGRNGGLPGAPRNVVVGVTYDF